MNKTDKTDFVASVLERIGFREHFMQRATLLEKNRYEVGDLHLNPHGKFFSALCNAYGFSLRDCEQVTHLFASSLERVEYHIKLYPEIMAFFSAMLVAHPDKFKKFLIAAEKVSGFHDLATFPFGELAEYYKGAIGDDFLQLPDPTPEQRLLASPYIWCCANRVLIDEQYGKEVAGLSQKTQNPTWERIYLYARSPNAGHIGYGGCGPHPTSVMGMVARVGKFKFREALENESSAPK